MKQKADFARWIIRGIVGSGVATIVTAIVNNNVPKKDRKKTKKVSVPVGGAVVGLMAGAAAVEFTDKIIDDAISGWQPVDKKDDPHIITTLPTE